MPTPCPYVYEDPAAQVIEFVTETADKISSTDDTEWLDSHAQEFRDDLFALKGMWLLTKTVKPGQRSWYVDYATRYTIRYSNSSRKAEIFILSKAPRPAMGPSSFLLNEYRAYFSAVKRVGPAEYHSPPSSVQIKNAWSYSSTPNIRLLSMDRYNFNILPFCKAGFCDRYVFTSNSDSSLQNLWLTSVLLLLLLLLLLLIIIIIIIKKQRNLFRSIVILLISKH